MALTICSNDEWYAVVGQSMTVIASKQLSLHSEQDYIVGKLPPVDGVRSDHQWFAIMNVFCLGTPLATKWLQKLKQAKNPPAMLYRLFPEIAADYVRLKGLQ